MVKGGRTCTCAPPLEMLKSVFMQMLSETSVNEVSASFWDNVNLKGFAPRPHRELPLDAAGRLPSFRPPHCPPLKKSGGRPCKFESWVRQYCCITCCPLKVHFKIWNTCPSLKYLAVILWHKKVCCWYRPSKYYEHWMWLNFLLLYVISVDE